MKLFLNFTLWPDLIAFSDKSAEDEFRLPVGKNVSEILYWRWILQLHMWKIALAQSKVTAPKYKSKGLLMHTTPQKHSPEVQIL